MSMLEDNDLFIFDWDGTLSTSSLIVAASRLLQRRYDPEYIRRHEEEYRKRVRDLDIHETKSRGLAWIYDAYVRFFPPRMKAGAIELLKRLDKKGKTMAVFSDSKSYRLMSELRMLGVMDYFDFVLSASTINRYKPDPTGILAVASRYKVRKDRCVYIGDTASDAMAAKFAGVKSCLVGDGMEPYPKLVAAEPDYLFRNLAGVIEEKTGRR